MTRTLVVPTDNEFAVQFYEEMCEGRAYVISGIVAVYPDLPGGQQTLSCSDVAPALGGGCVANDHACAVLPCFCIEMHAHYGRGCKLSSILCWRFALEPRRRLLLGTLHVKPSRWRRTKQSVAPPAGLSGLRPSSRQFVCSYFELENTKS